ATRPPDERAPLRRARERLHAVIADLSADPLPDGLYGAWLGDEGNPINLASVQQAIRERLKLQLLYRRSGGVGVEERMVRPYALVAASGQFYAIAHCEKRDGVRVFRMDRVEGAVVTSETFTRPREFSADKELQKGFVFIHDHPARMMVRYSARIARWIAEREGKELDDDGGLVVEHPLVDFEWGMRHVMQYGAEAEVLEPIELRERLVRRLEKLLRASRSDAPTGNARG
ncbi:MAG: WYL domain-containing protein, partial [Gemmatimonadaceae bacterium]